MGIFKKPPKPPHLRQVQVEPGPDEYGRRPQPQYEHQEIVMSNEYVAFIGHLDNVFEDLRNEFNRLEEYKESLKAAIHGKTIELITLVAREKEIVIDLRAHFQDLQARIDGTRNGDTAGRTAVDETPHEPEAA